MKIVIKTVKNTMIKTVIKIIKNIEIKTVLKTALKTPAHRVAATLSGHRFHSRVIDQPWGDQSKTTA